MSFLKKVTLQMSQLNVFSLHEQAPGTLLWPLLVPVMGTSKKWSLKVTPPVSCMRTYPYARGTQWDLTLYLTWNANMSMWWQTRKCQRYVLLWHFEVMFLLYFVIPTLFSGLFFHLLQKDLIITEKIDFLFCYIPSVIVKNLCFFDQNLFHAISSVSEKVSGHNL